MGCIKLEIIENYAQYEVFHCIVNNACDNTRTFAQDTAFDPWGKRRNPSDWSYNNVPTTYMFDRGYTGHEMLDAFGLINMNGRIYDSKIHRFISPDRYIQDPYLPQNYNRYSYCLNNPLKYVDPDGEFWHLVIGAAIGGILNWATNGAEFTWEGLGYFGIGALAGALGAGVGAGISSAIAGGSFGAGFIGSSAALTSTGALSGMAVGAGAGFSSGFTTGLGNGLMQGQNFGNALLSGAISGLITWGAGAVLGGIVGGLDAVSKGREFWSGSYKQYDLQPTLLASADNYVSATEYIVPEDATVVNADQYKVYYKPEDGVYGTKNYVSSGKYITKPIDGVATSKHTDMVFKVPSGGRVYVNLGGDVKFINGYGFYDALKWVNKAGWQNAQYFINKGAYYNQWDMLFKLALIIK